MYSRFVSLLWLITLPVAQCLLKADNWSIVQHSLFPYFYNELHLSAPGSKSASPLGASVAGWQTAQRTYRTISVISALLPGNVEGIIHVEGAVNHCGTWASSSSQYKYFTSSKTDFFCVVAYAETDKVPETTAPYASTYRRVEVNLKPGVRSQGLQFCEVQVRRMLLRNGLKLIPM